MLYDNYQSPWLNDELRILRDAAGRFFQKEFVPEERTLDQPRARSIGKPG